MIYGAHLHYAAVHRFLVHCACWNLLAEQASSDSASTQPTQRESITRVGVKIRTDSTDADIMEYFRYISNLMSLFKQRSAGALCVVVQPGGANATRLAQGVRARVEHEMKEQVPGVRVLSTTE
jgi:hypothetical protein